MGKINLGRVLLGGLVAGLILNVAMALTWGWLLADQHAEAMAALGMAEPMGAQIAWYWVFGFAFGIVLVWTYAAIRPRFGPGPRTAAWAGILVWVLGWVFPDLFMLVMGLFPLDLILMGWLIGLVTLIVAGLAGGALYQEGGAAQGSAVAPEGRTL